MSIRQTIKNIFGARKGQTDVLSTSIPNLFFFLKSLINSEDLVAKEIKQFKEAMNLPAEEGEVVLLPLYFALEKFITSNKPLVVKRELSKETLREEVRKNINIEKLDTAFKLIFLSEREQDIALFELELQKVSESIVKNVGVVGLRNIVLKLTPGTLFDPVDIDDKGINFKSANSALVLPTTSDKDLHAAFKHLMTGMYDATRELLGEKNAEKNIRDIYTFIKSRYPYEILVRAFDILPETVLQDERLGLLSRDDLEKKVTEATAAIKEERDLSRAIISSMGEGLFVVNKAYKVIVMNKTAEQLLGLSSENALGRDLPDLVFVYRDGNEFLHDERPLGRTLKTGESVTFGIEDNISIAVPSSNVKFFVSLSTSPLLGNGITGAVVVFRDVSEEKKLNDAKTNFISIASHQLRTPLTAIRWYSEMLISGDAGALNNDQKQFMNQVYSGTTRLIDMVNLLLSLARIEGGRVKIEPFKIDIVDFARGVIKELEPFIQKKNLKVSVVEPGTKIPAISLDPSMLRQVVSNIISNSIRYTSEHGKIEIEFSSDDTRVTVSVKDDGIGIPEAQKSRVFEKFFRADNALQKVPEGTGLGLNLVKALVELWNGEIAFESPVAWKGNPGGGQKKGTRFYFTIPYEGIKAKLEGKSLA